MLTLRLRPHRRAGRLYYGHGGRRRNTRESRAAPPPVDVEIPQYYAPFLLNRETSDGELDAWGYRNIDGFRGCISRDEYPLLYPPGEPMEPGSSCIVNLDGHYRHGGTHWCGARVAQEAPILCYYDPFGLPPPREVTLRARADGRTVIYQDIDQQFPWDTNCGPRCLAFLDYLEEAAKDGDELAAFARVAQVD